MENNFAPDKAAMIAHLTFLFGDQPDGKIEIAYTPSNTGAVSKAEFFDISDIEKAAQFAANQNAIEGVNVYVGAALRKPDTAPFGRSNADDYYKATAIWCDLDEAQAAKEAKDKYKDMPPSFVVVTGRHPDLRAQVWWKLDRPQQDKVEHKKALASVCHALHGDKSVVDPARVMRLGGSIAWPKKEGRIPEKTEIKTPANATGKVSFAAFQGYFPAANPVDKQEAAGGVGHLNLGNRHNDNSKDEWSIDQICDMLNHIQPDNDYLDWVHVGMALKDYGIGFDIWDAWSSRGPKYPGTTELYKKWQSFAGVGVTIGSLYYQAHQGGYHPSKYRKTVAQTITASGAEKAEEFDPETGEIKAEPKGRELPVLFAGDVQPVTHTSDFVEDLLRDNEFSVIYGESNCGKTFFMLDLAMHVALGRKWRDKEVEQGGVIYAALEGGHGTKNRIVAFRQHHEINEDIPLAVIPSNINLLDSQDDMTAFIQAIEKAKSRLQNVRLIVIDTLARAISGGDENSSQDMGTLISNADALRGLTGAHIAFIHHSGKDALKGARGHSSLRAAVDTEIEISRQDAESPSQIKIVKQREMEMIEPMAFSLKSTVLGVNKRKKEVTSCVVVPCAVVTVEKEIKLTSIEKFIFDALLDCIISNGVARTVQKDALPVQSVTYFELYASLESRGFKELIDKEGEVDAKTIKAATNAARIGLKNKGKINFNSSFIWVIS